MSAKTGHLPVQNFRAILLCSIAAIVPLAPAQAAEADEAAAEGEIVVSGARPIAESEAAALLVQKNSDSLVSVAASDSVGRLPDQNIAQAASRLPGIAIERDQGQAPGHRCGGGRAAQGLRPSAASRRGRA